MPISVAMMLARFASTEGDGLSLVGGGWIVRDPEPAGTAAIGINIYVPRSEAGIERQVRLELLDDSGKRVSVARDGGHEELVVETTILPDGLRDRSIKTPLVTHLAVSLPPFPLEPGRDFQWRLYLDDETRGDWMLPFRTTPPEAS